HEDRLRGPRERAEFGRDILEQLLHASGAMADHRPDHRLEHVGMNVGGSGEEELAECGGSGGRGHAPIRDNSSTKPPTATSLVFTSRTPSSPHSLSRCSATSRSIGFIASTTANSRTWGRCCSSPSIAYLSQTSSATPYNTMSCGFNTSSTGRTFGLENTSKRCL